MLEELQPLTLTDAARRLGVDPLEVVRLLVAAGKVSDGAMNVDPLAIEELRALGRIEGSWWDGAALPEDDDPRRARIRAAVGQLVERKHVGDAAATRMDNVWRGLPFEEQELVQRALAALASDGTLRIVATNVGLMISVADGQEATVKGIVSGKKVPSSVTAVLDGQG